MQKWKIIGIVLGAAVVVGIGGVSSLRAQTPHAEPEIAGHRGWTRVNGTPYSVQSILAVLCATPSQQMLDQEASNPHVDTSSARGVKFVTVYVNAIAREAMLHSRKPRFPAGSVIVKEKLPTATSGAPELLTAMRKRERGFNAASGDWEYLVLDGQGKNVQARGRLKACMSCHATWKETDYVSREYLSPEMIRKLR